MTRTSTANPRRTTLASLPSGSPLTSCQVGTDGCVNVATRVVLTTEGSRPACGHCVTA